MAVFPTNQNRHLYVVSGAYAATITDASNVGNLGQFKVADNCLHFLYKGPGGVIKSDYIDLANLDKARTKAVAAFDMARPLKQITVTLDSNVNSGNPIAGQDYVLRINLRQWFGMSDEDQYFKDACVHATSTMAADKKEFYKAMVKALNQSFSREVGATANSNPYLDFSAGTSGSENGIYITEKEHNDWVLGIHKNDPVLFEVQDTTIYDGDEDILWAKIKDTTPKKYVEDENSESATYEQIIPNPELVVGTNAVGNGKDIADLEWFCMGERGDQYRMVGYPNYIPTKYLVDETKQYDVIEIHHAFTDTGVNSYRSEKDITIVVPLGASDHEHDVANAIIGAINTAVGSTVISTLS